MVEKVVFQRRLDRDERVFGLGDQVGSLDRRGGVYTLWNKDSFALLVGRDPHYRAIPIVFGVSPRRAWGVYVESTGRLVFDCRGGELRVLASGDPPVHEVEGVRFAELVGRISELVGRAPLPPRWALGYHQSRWSYGSAGEALGVAREFRTRGIGLDALHLDIGYMDGYRVFTWDRERFPDPAGLVAELHELGVRVVTIVDPGVKVDPAYRVYEELVGEGLACVGRKGRPWVGRVWPGKCIFPDFSRPEVRSWWGEMHAELVSVGVEGVWIDMNEPSTRYLRTMPKAVRGFGGELHNAYAHLMAQATHEGLMRLRPGFRPFVLSRSGCAGTQRYAATWTGDNRSTWRHMRIALRMCLGLGLSGYPFTGSDVGGFVGRCSPELYARWFQLGCFSPFFRTHYAGWLTRGRQEPWSFGPEVEAIARETVELRRLLAQYTYTALWRHTQTGLPVMRALALEWQDDPRALDCEDEFLWGDDLLVAPVLDQGARRRPVYLPPGDWYDFWTGKRLSGPATVVADAPLERIPLFVRAGTVLPLADGTLRVYPGDGTSWLYEDDGEAVEGAAGATAFDMRGERVSATRDGDFPSAFSLERLAAS